MQSLVSMFIPMSSYSNRLALKNKNSCSPGGVVRLFRKVEGKVSENHERGAYGLTRGAEETEKGLQSQFLYESHRLSQY